jgi:hypothetical protein
MSDDQAKPTAVRLNEIILTAKIPHDDGRSTDYTVRFVGVTGDGTMRFVVRRIVNSAPINTFVIPKAPIPQQWECSIPVNDGKATAHWWFGEREHESLTMHFLVDEVGFVFPVEPDALKKSSRLGFRQAQDDD